MTRKWSILLLAALFAMMALVSPAAPASAQGPNLLQNPGMEAPFAASLPGKENCLIAVPWLAWFVEGNAEQTAAGYLLAPEYKMATWADYPGNRVRSGSLSQQYFHSFGNFQAGIYQVVNGVKAGQRLRFTIWALTWSCDDESKGNCAGATSGDPSPMHLRIGIDPDGGTDPFAPEIVWSSEINAYDAWHPLAVEATAAASTVTVFVYSYPDYRSQDNNVYLDDAELVVVAPPATDTPEPTLTSEVTETPNVTETPAASATPEPSQTPQETASSTPTPAATKTEPASAAPANTSEPTAQPPEAQATAAPQLTTADEHASSSQNRWVIPVVAVASLVAVAVYAYSRGGVRRRRRRY
ncbi:MAG: hypothetical protein GXY52_02250 [Chloroflexi bacterium]|nr:hypothetical protein [Chloroflexota bacterium]